MRRAYHGSTHGAMTMMGTPEGEEWKAAFRPLLPDVQAIEFNDFAQLGRITRRTACVLVEPVQGEAGVRLPAAGYLEALRRRCDEVGRCSSSTRSDRPGTHGRAVRHAEVRRNARHRLPGQGLRRRHAPRCLHFEPCDHGYALQSNPVLGHITTFGGHPVCCAAGLAALNYLLEHDLVRQVEAKGPFTNSCLARIPPCGRSCSGLLLAVELGSSGVFFRMMALFKEEGILSDWFLFCDTAFRISPPLTVSEEEVRDSAAIILRCLDRL